MKKFGETGSTVDLKSPRCPREQRSLENIVAVRDNVNVSPKKSVRRRSQ